MKEYHLCCEVPEESQERYDRDVARIDQAFANVGKAVENRLEGCDCQKTIAKNLKAMRLLALACLCDKYAEMPAEEPEPVLLAE